MTNKLTVLSVAMAAVMTSSAAMAELTANAAASTNYIWRGATQTGDASAVSGGIDWANDDGLYAGTWVSNIAGGQELDFYAGYATDMFDVGVITYQYPVTPNINFTEVYVGVTVDNFSASLASTVNAASGNTGAAFDEGDMYISVGADFEPISVWVGSYMFDADAAGNPLDYVHYGVSTSKDDFTFSIDKTDQDGAAGNMRVGITWSKEWTL